MKALINGVVYDSETTPIVLIWDTDKERVNTGNQIAYMASKEGIRAFSQCNKTLSPEFDLDISIKKYIDGKFNCDSF